MPRARRLRVGQFRPAALTCWPFGIAVIARQVFMAMETETKEIVALKKIRMDLRAGVRTPAARASRGLRFEIRSCRSSQFF